MTAESTPMLGRVRKALLQPRTAMILLACAAACAVSVEILMNSDMFERHELVSVDTAKEDGAPAATDKEPTMSITKKAEKLIRTIPLVGQKIADWAAVRIAHPCLIYVAVFLREKSAG
jgi:hypothetical protein